MKLFILSLLALSTAVLTAQQTLPTGQNYYNEGPAGIVYNKEVTFDFRLITPRAFGVGVSFGNIIAYNKTRFYNIEFGDIRHPQEYRQRFEYQIPTTNRVSRAFIYGKQNSAFVLRAGIGEKRYFSEKAKNRGLAVGVSYQAGLNLGIMKPYYLELLRVRETGTINTIISEERYSPEMADVFLGTNSVIIGASSFSAGLTELSVIPGIHLKAAAHFDWGAFDEFVKAIEGGIMLDLFLKDVPIMVEDPLVPHLKNSPILLNFYINFQLGKRS